MKKILLAVAFLGALVPAIFVIREAGGMDAWQGVMPRGTTDSMYYYARLHEVADGHLLAGNPYAYEHRESLSPASFVPDILTALPVALGIPFDIAMEANIFLWSAIFLLLSFVLLRRVGVGARSAVLWSVLAYAASYSFMLRPTVMQVVYPAFLLFLLALAVFLRRPDRRSALFLAGGSALAFYVYTYLAYVVILTLGAVFLWTLAGRRFKETRLLLLVGAASVALLVPFGIYTLLQIRGDHYLETLVRLGLVHTRIPSMEAYYYGRWIAISAALFAVFLWVRHRRGESSGSAVLWISSGIGLLVASVLNVFTTAELELGIHIGRISLPWVPLALGAAISQWYSLSPMLAKKEHLIIAILCLALLVGTAASARRGLDFTGFAARGQTVAEVQAYAAPLRWLEENVPEESVIWSDDAIAQHVPVMTRHYSLFHTSVQLQLVSNEEVEERYLLSRTFSELSIEDLKRDHGLYAGGGPNKTQPLAHNRRAALCRLLSHAGGSGECPEETDALALRGEEYFADMERRFHKVKEERDALLERYHVDFLLYDRERDEWKDVLLSQAVYDDGRFAIVPLPW